MTQLAVAEATSKQGNSDIMTYQDLQYVKEHLYVFGYPVYIYIYE